MMTYVAFDRLYYFHYFSRMSVHWKETPFPEERMAFRNDLPYLEILATQFQAFDRGERVEMNIPEAWNLTDGDRLWWACAQFDGIALVVEASEGTCLLQKLS